MRGGGLTVTMGVVTLHFLLPDLSPPYTHQARGVNGNGSEETWPRPKESLPLLPQGGLPAARVRGLQRRADSEEAVYEPGQDGQPQAHRQLRRLPARREGRRQARPVPGAVALRRRM